MKNMRDFFFKLIQKIITKTQNKNQINENVIIDNGSKIIGSVIESNSKIGKNTIIINSKIGFSSLIGNKNWINESILSSHFSSEVGCKINQAKLFGNISIGRYTSLWGPNLDIVTGESIVKIGAFCSIARNVTMQTFNHNSKKLTSYFIGQNFFNENWDNERVYKRFGIEIKNDVWIGSHCVILGGVTIHNGAIVAANSVVNKDVPAFSIVAGNPAKVIGYRFDEETIKKIEKMSWWEWSEEKIRLNKHLFENEFNFKDNNFKVF